MKTIVFLKEKREISTLPTGLFPAGMIEGKTEFNQNYVTVEFPTVGKVHIPWHNIAIVKEVKDD